MQIRPTLGLFVESPVVFHVFYGIVFHFKESSIAFRTIACNKIQHSSCYLVLVFKFFVGSIVSGKVFSVPVRAKQRRKINNLIFGVDFESVGTCKEFLRLFVEFLIEA